MTENGILLNYMIFLSSVNTVLSCEWNAWLWNRLHGNVWVYDNRDISTIM